MFGLHQSADGAAAGASQAGDPVASTPGSDLARRVDANISALQVLHSITPAAHTKPAHQYRASQCLSNLTVQAREMHERGASVVHHILQQCRSLQAAVQADYAKLQAAYQAMKRQSAHPAAAVPLAAPALPSDSFLKLQVLLVADAARLPPYGIHLMACYALYSLSGSNVCLAM